MRGLLLVALAVALVGGSQGAAETDRPTREPTERPQADPGYITRADYGDDWPFSVAAGTLSCYDGASAGGGGRILVTFSAGDGIEYGLNGSARDFGFPDLDGTIMPSWPDKSMLTDLIAVGLELCE